MTSATSRPLYGLVLAGGSSRRMGMDKWRLDYHGAPHAVHLHALLGARLGRAFVSVRPAQALEPELARLPLVVDAYDDMGPLGGILTAMSSFPDAAWLVLACDMPFVGDATIARLVARRAPLKLATAYRSSLDGLPEPLCAIYEPEARIPLLDLAEQGHAGPRAMLLAGDVSLLDAAEERELQNVNRQPEHGRALDLLRAGRTP